MSTSNRNSVIHDRNPSIYLGNYQITDQALTNYGTTREKFGSTDILLPEGKSFNVKDYQYLLEDGSVGMYFIPVNEYGVFQGPEGKEVYASQLIYTFLREKLCLKEDDPLYAYMYYIHPELNRNTIMGFAKTEKIEMGITHMGAYYGRGVTSNAPPWYHNRSWGVAPRGKAKYGYPCNVMIISLDGVDQAMLNKNLILTDKFLNYGVRFPIDYKNSKFRMVDINTSLMFYRDWILEKEYLKTDVSWFTYCAAHKTVVTTVALNLPHNKKSFMEVYGDQEGSVFYDIFVKNYFELAGEEFTKELETDFEPLWKKEGFTREQIKPFNYDEYVAYDNARRKGELNSFKGFKPLKPTQATPWGPQFTADIVFDFVEAYADFLDAGAIISSATILGFMGPATERMGISKLEYLMTAMPIIEILMQAHAMIYAPSDPNPDHKESTYYKQTMEGLFLAFGGKPSDTKKLENTGGLLQRFEGKLEEFVSFTLKDKLLPEFMAWWAMTRVRKYWSTIISQPNSLPENAYEWLRSNVEKEFEKARDIVTTDDHKIQFNTPPAIGHMIGVGLFSKNPHIDFKTVCTVMDHTELELKT